MKYHIHQLHMMGTYCSRIVHDHNLQFQTIELINEFILDDRWNRFAANFLGKPVLFELFH